MIETILWITLGVIIAPIIILTLWAILTTWVGVFIGCKRAIQSRNAHPIKKTCEVCKDKADEAEEMLGVTE